MTILRIQKKQRNFMILDKGFARDKRLTWQARGLMVYLMTLPHDWKLYLKEL